MRESSLRMRRERPCGRWQGDPTGHAACMHWFTLITRPGRAAALVATVGLLFGAQSVLAARRCRRPAATARWSRSAPRSWRSACSRPLHSRCRRNRGRRLARIGLRSDRRTRRQERSRPDWSVWLPLLVVTLAVAAGGMAWLVLARRDEGDIPGHLLELALAGTVVGVLFTRRSVDVCRAGAPVAGSRSGALERLRGAGLQPGTVTRLSRCLRRRA